MSTQFVVIIAVSDVHYITDSCQDGDVRLVGSQSVYEGRVEVCLSQRWGTVTDDGWSTAEAQVVCKQLGYSSQGVLFFVVLELHKIRKRTKPF